MPDFTIGDLKLDEHGKIAAEAKARVETWIEAEVRRRTHDVEHRLMLVIGMLAARHPDGIVTFTFDEYDRARAGRLIREPDLADPRRVSFRFLPA